jgi:hypothetical protein
MTTAEALTASTTIEAPAAAVFAVLTDPTQHPAIDGTGWVREPVDTGRLTEPGQTFRMAMYNPNHPDKNYEMTNRIQVFESPSTISWEPGGITEGQLRFGGWFWRYDLAPDGPSTTKVTLTYDWSAVPEQLRQFIQFPPFGPDHLQNSLAHLSSLATSSAA